MGAIATKDTAHAPAPADKDSDMALLKPEIMLGDLPLVFAIRRNDLTELVEPE